ncbi:MAG TPA: substrate-binding domain-containing protein [Symbiobacteriaceae bacterium]|nr:substrate-binding domain-containing protein [Symbiobacteriaceae bacterium]
MTREVTLQNNLRRTRTRLGLSQQDLAGRAGVTRQTISGVEGGLYAPSATVALRLAKALGCRVEDLFWLEEALPEIEAVPAAGLPAGTGLRVALARVCGRWVAHSLMGDDGFRTELIPTDGEAAWDGQTATLRVHTLDDPENLYHSVMLAGCTPALSLWARAAERWNPGLRVLWTFANSMDALHRLARGDVHAAGVHLYDPESGAFNVPFVQAVLPNRSVVLVNLGVWEEGIVVQPGNPKRLAGAADLAQPGLTIVNREPGAGSRQLLERMLCEEGIPFASVQGFDSEVRGHIEVARAVAEGRADAGISAAAVAASFGLGFVPLHRARYDIAIPGDYMAEAPVQQLVSTLGHRRVREQLQMLGGYDTSQTGDIVAVVGE